MRLRSPEWRDRALWSTLPLTGLLLCTHFLYEQPQQQEFSSGNDDLEEIRLRSGEDLTVVHDASFSRRGMRSFTVVPVFVQLYGERYLLIHRQIVSSARQPETAAVLYVHFRNVEDAHWGKRRTDEWEGFVSPVTSRVFGTFLVTVSVPGEEFAHLSKVIFERIEEQLGGGGVQP